MFINHLLTGMIRQVDEPWIPATPQYTHRPSHQQMLDPSVTLLQLG